MYDYDSVPEEKLWNDVDGTNYLTVVKNQHLPQYCGSCWAQCVASSLSDRIKIMRKGAWPDVNIAPQVFVSCSMEDNGCHGGDMITAFQFGNENELTDETCSIYHARGHDNGYECAPVVKCRNCNPYDDCFIPDTYKTYKVAQFGRISGEKDMMAEIAQNGPITCAIDATDELYYNYTGGIFEDKTGASDLNHGISVVGYGVEDGVKYWHVRNSWGETWGEKGFFKVVRGVNNIGIESDCAFGIPEDTWTDQAYHTTTDEERKDPRNDYTNGPYPTKKVEKLIKEKEYTHSCYIEGEWTEEERNFVPEQIQEMNDDVPEAIDWRNYEGKNYLSWNKNQHIPIYCGSCWAEGSTSALADRFNIYNWLTLGKTSEPQLSLSAQAIVNCHAGGDCSGGFHGQVYRYAQQNGIPHGSCEQYIAHNADDICSAFNVCRECVGPAPPADETGFDKCWPVENYNRYKSKKVRSFSGAQAMKEEIATFGPISCGIDSTEAFHNYKGGIFEEKGQTSINHIISLVGYGVDQETGTEYWIGRNSWGTYWGEGGFFRIKMHSDNNAIERDCAAGYPDVEEDYSQIFE
uniref:Peptidase C1A papain C-terminal domain-containing protein n=1 Tax=Euplotes crassus TaxID=5936 RepID=A0A7S3NSC1_EUPCR|eukprot:CAMPEP_0196997470 /NCGR_PEP_ID=MMETSP1380-20130617/3057_1 /TAXON_ID=5936 /ORGANISM="Euplotes crassus, Strain CT5" /LENGTH=575 /DNA_ID=CAMNT_0042413709 /DNA_START=161 /DNA_END=1888 /DNA_ORIENTATION=+